MIYISKKSHKFLLKLLPQLIDSGVMTKEESSKILSCLSPMVFDWKRLARYALWMAVISLIIAITAAFTDRWLMQFLSQLLTAPAEAKMIVCSILTIIFYTYGAVRRSQKPQHMYINESVMFLGVLATAGTLFWLGECIGSNSNHFSFLILVATICYGILGFLLKSQLIWCFSLLSLGGWLGAETGYMSGWGAYFFGLNYPLRFVFFGMISLCFTIIFRKNAAFQPFYPVTRNMSLLYLFLSLWIMSIFGNYGDIAVWYQVKQTELLHWSLLFGCASGLVIYLGCRWDEASYRGFGLTFLFINLYTRFFELFWEPLHKALFFSLLAFSLWYLGSRAEKFGLKVSV